MSTKIFENIIENNLEGRISSKGGYYAQKLDSFVFRDLIKSQTVQSKTSDYKSEQKKIKASEPKQVSGNKDANQDSNKLCTNADYSSEAQSSKITTPSIDKAISAPEKQNDIIQEEASILEEYITQDREPDLISLDTIFAVERDKEAEFSDITDNTYIRDNIVTSDSTLDSDKLVAFENINNENETVFVIPELSVIPKLLDQDNTTHQRLKAFELSNGFTSQDLVKRDELLIDKLQTSLVPNGISELEELSAKLEAPIKLTIENESRKNITGNAKPIIITPSLNLALADTTEHGKEVISRMQATLPTDEQNPGSSLEIESFVLENKAPLFNFSDKNGINPGQRKPTSLEPFDAVMEQTNDGIFEITFEGNNNNLKHPETPKLPMQVSLAIKEVLNLNSDSGKKQITINLHPHSLGAVKVEILSQIGQDGVNKIESVKISADKHETLLMLEERKADLCKSLKEVNGAQEKETSLQFEMSHDQGKGQEAYFSSMEERDNWMSKFAGLISDDPVNEKQELIIDEYATRGIVTKDKIDLIT